MAEFNTELCETCPSRGLCVGNVELGVVPLTYGEGERSFPGYALNVTDEDGVTNAVINVAPESYTIQTKKGERVVETNPARAIRSDGIFQSLQENPEALTDSIVERARKCSGPGSREYVSGFAFTYERVCRATAKPVLEALAAMSDKPAEA